MYCIPIILPLLLSHFGPLLGMHMQYAICNTVWYGTVYVQIVWYVQIVRYVQYVQYVQIVWYVQHTRYVQYLQYCMYVLPNIRITFKTFTNIVG